MAVIVALLSVLVATPVAALAQPADAKFRLESWTKYRAECEKGPGRYSFDNEVLQFVPNEVRRRPTLDYKSFCECRYDGLNAAIGVDLASHLKALDWGSLPPAESAKFQAANKEVFTKCFMEHTRGEAAAPTGPGITDAQLKELRSRVDIECTNKFNETLKRYSQEGSAAKTPLAKSLARNNYESTLKAQGEICNAKRTKLIEMQGEAPAARRLPPGF